MSRIYITHMYPQVISLEAFTKRTPATDMHKLLAEREVTYNLLSALYVNRGAPEQALDTINKCINDQLHEWWLQSYFSAEVFKLAKEIATRVCAVSGATSYSATADAEYSFPCVLSPSDVASVRKNITDQWPGLVIRYN